MMPEPDQNAPLEPDSSLLAMPPATWQPMAATMPLLAHVGQRYWPHRQPPGSWEAARLSSAVFLFREGGSGWSFVAKFHTAKTGGDALRHACREAEAIGQARAAGLDAPPYRAVHVLGLWRGVLLLEHVPGLTLLDHIAVRDSQPGCLGQSLRAAAQTLARLHAADIPGGQNANGSRALDKAHKYSRELHQYGVLQHEPAITGSLTRLLTAWAEQAALFDYSPTLIHGDATTTNFITADDGQMVAIDWERLEVADPAADIGRLAAEVWHGIRDHGGHGDEADELARCLLDTYLDALPSHVQRARLARRARFYQASSILRIARNGWIARLDRLALVAQALSLLSDGLLANGGFDLATGPAD